MISRISQLQEPGTTTLDTLAVGAHGVVTSVEGEGSFRRRLLELGFLPGTDVVRTGQAPLGDPLTILVRGAVLCLREIDARNVRVRV
jgi:Fe2+ transport system protein FeoA